MPEIERLPGNVRKRIGAIAAGGGGDMFVELPPATTPEVGPGSEFTGEIAVGASRCKIMSVEVVPSRSVSGFRIAFHQDAARARLAYLADTTGLPDYGGGVSVRDPEQGYDVIPYRDLDETGSIHYTIVNLDNSVGAAFEIHLTIERG